MNVDREDPDGRTHINRIFFYDIRDGAFNWRQERGYDNGETRELYIRTESGPPSTDP